MIHLGYGGDDGDGDKPPVELSFFGACVLVVACVILLALFVWLTSHANGR